MVGTGVKFTSNSINKCFCPLLRDPQLIDSTDSSTSKFVAVLCVCGHKTGEAELPTSQVIQKQSVIIDQLKSKLDLGEVEHLDKLRSALSPMHLQLVK